MFKFSVQEGRKKRKSCMGIASSGDRLPRAISVPAEGLPESLKCYPAREHLLVFDVQPASLVLLTVTHGSRDIPNRLGELVPTLAAEVELLHGKLRSGKKN